MITTRWTSTGASFSTVAIPERTPAHELEALFMQWHVADDKNAFMCSLPLNQAHALLDLITQRVPRQPVVSRKERAITRITAMLPADTTVTAEQVYALLIDRLGHCPRIDHLQKHVTAAVKELS